MDVGDDSTTSNGSLDQRIQFFIAPDSELQVSGGYSLDLQVLAGVSCEFEDLSGEVLQDSSGVDR